MAGMPVLLPAGQEPDQPQGRSRQQKNMGANVKANFFARSLVMRRHVHLQVAPRIFILANEYLN